jgi:hypothetical protein
MRKVVTVLFLALVACDCTNDLTTPSDPTSRTIAVLMEPPANLANFNFDAWFGDYRVGAPPQTAAMTITNYGNAPLTIEGVVTPHGFTSSWTSGVIAARQSTTAMITFTPDTPGSYGGTITVKGDQTGGGNTVLVEAFARQAFSGSWTGTLTISAPGQSTVCSESWIIDTDDYDDGILGTWQSHGEVSTSCDAAGVLYGDAQANSVSIDLTLDQVPFQYPALGANSDCTAVASGRTPYFTGAISGAAPRPMLTATVNDSLHCPGVSDVTRSLTLSMTQVGDADINKAPSAATHGGGALAHRMRLQGKS